LNFCLNLHIKQNRKESSKNTSEKFRTFCNEIKSLNVFKCFVGFQQNRKFVFDRK
jgi:hypothetical protein